MQGRATRAVALASPENPVEGPVMSRISSRSFWDFGNTAVVMNLGTKGEGEASSRRNILIPQSSEAFMAVPDDVLQEHTELFFRRRLGSDDPVQILQAQHLPVRLDQHFLVQAFLAAEVVVHGGAVRSRRSQISLLVASAKPRSAKTLPAASRTTARVERPSLRCARLGR